MQRSRSALQMLSLALLLASCGSDDDNDNNNNTGDGGPGGGNTGDGDGDGDGGTSGGGNNGFSEGRDETGQCINDGSDQCSQEEIKPYLDCIQSACNDKFKACFGDDYASGELSGPCKDYSECTRKCDCGDADCVSKCTPSADCTSCTSDVSQCFLNADCTLPACATQLPDGGSLGGGDNGEKHTCDELMACCDALTDATQKDNCQAALDAVKAGGDNACDLAYAAFEQSNFCD
jgi:hypothetical protein